MNYNESSGSQTTPKIYTDKLNPEFIDAVQKDGARGDFISLITRGPDDLEMVNRFEKQWQHNIVRRKLETNSTAPKNKSDFKMRRMELSDGRKGEGFEGGRFPARGILMNNTDFLRSDHAAFWFSNHRDYYASFKAVHVSDTGNHF